MGLAEHRHKVDEEILSLVPVLVPVLRHAVAIAENHGVWSYERYGKTKGASINHSSGIGTITDPSELLSILLNSWNDISGLWQPYDIHYKQIDRVRRIRNEWAHNDPRLNDKIYVDRCLSTVRRLRGSLRKAHQDIDQDRFVIPVEFGKQRNTGSSSTASVTPMTRSSKSSTYTKTDAKIGVFWCVYFIFSITFWQHVGWDMYMSIFCRRSFYTDSYFWEDFCLFLYEYSLNWGAHILWSGSLNTFSATWWGVLLISVATIGGMMFWALLLMLTFFLMLVIAVVVVVVVVLWMVAEVVSWIVE